LLWLDEARLCFVDGRLCLDIAMSFYVIAMSSQRHACLWLVTPCPRLGVPRFCGHP
jgi:hypothetical protein